MVCSPRVEAGRRWPATDGQRWWRTPRWQRRTGERPATRSCATRAARDPGALCGVHLLRRSTEPANRAAAGAPRGGRCAAGRRRRRATGRGRRRRAGQQQLGRQGSRAARRRFFIGARAGGGALPRAAAAAMAAGRMGPAGPRLGQRGQARRTGSGLRARPVRIGFFFLFFSEIFSSAYEIPEKVQKIR
jgi:hypothetical protein